MTKIILIRHGQSLSNLQNTLTGQVNSPLTELGLKQADLACEYVIKNYTVDAVYSSDLSRAKETVAKISEHFNTPIITDPRLREIYSGKWDGQSFDYLMTLPQYTEWVSNMGVLKSDQGESFSDVYDRAVCALNEIIEKHPNQTVAIGTHGGAIRCLQCYFAGKTTKDIYDVPWVPNASTTVVNYKDGKFNTELNGYCEYLGDMITVLSKTLK